MSDSWVRPANSGMSFEYLCVGDDVIRRDIGNQDASYRIAKLHITDTGDYTIIPPKIVGRFRRMTDREIERYGDEL